MTASQLIFRAASRTPSVTAGKGTVAYDPEAVAGPVADSVCWLCGEATDGRGQPTRTAIKPTFTNIDLAKAPSSGSLCAPCAFCLGNASLRQYPTVATTEGIRHPSRAQLKGVLLEPPDPPFLIAIPTSGHKHLVIRTPVAWARDDYPVALEEVLLTVERPRLRAMVETVEILRTAFTLDEVRSGHYQHGLRGLSLRDFEAAEADAAAWRGHRLFSLALHVSSKPGTDEPAAPAEATA